MRKLKLLAVLLALVGAMVILTASPTMAGHDDDGWWDDCDWAWSPGWGWFVVCDVDDDFDRVGTTFWDDDDHCWEWSRVFEEWQWECDDLNWWERDRHHDWNWWDRDRNWWNRDWWNRDWWNRD